MEQVPCYFPALIKFCEAILGDHWLNMAMITPARLLILFILNTCKVTTSPPKLKEVEWAYYVCRNLKNQIRLSLYPNPNVFCKKMLFFALPIYFCVTYS